MNDHRITNKETNDEIGISFGSEQLILTKDLRRQQRLSIMEDREHP